MTARPVDTLFIAASFFGYAAEIRRAMEARGRSVQWHEDRPALDTYTKGALRLAPQMVAEKADAYFRAIIAAVKDQPIRDVLIIKGEALSPRMIDEMRAAFPAARFTLYFWDGSQNLPKDTPQKMTRVDRVLSFDPADVRANPAIVYRPLFFLEEYAALPDEGGDIDLLFFGTLHTDRKPVCDRIAAALPKGRALKAMFYVRSPLMLTLQKSYRPSYWGFAPGELLFKPMGKADVTALIARARVVVDIERPVQTGYTMRTIEMLGGRRKLVTTNPELKTADFYDPQNIAVIDRARPVLDEAFLNAPYRAPPAEIVRRYSLAGWLDDVLP
ncbi:MAG: hypothetical protein NW200_02085 [Hyphomonadaceae bacterium]|nr:hypothetical protein [Hyphomonadaceae bacterium]